MSEVTLNFESQNNDISLVVNPNNIKITPSDIKLNLYPGAAPMAGGSAGQFQYNNGGLLGGASGLTYNTTNNTTTVSNIVVSTSANLGSVSNIFITGGSANYALVTDGTGNLAFASKVAIIFHFIPVL